MKALVLLCTLAACSPVPLTDSQVATALALCERQGMIAKIVNTPLTTTVECVARPVFDSKNMERRV